MSARGEARTSNVYSDNGMAVSWSSLTWTTRCSSAAEHVIKAKWNLSNNRLGTSQFICLISKDVWCEPMQTGASLRRRWDHQCILGWDRSCPPLQPRKSLAEVCRHSRSCVISLHQVISIADSNVSCGMGFPLHFAKYILPESHNPRKEVWLYCTLQQ